MGVSPGCDPRGGLVAHHPMTVAIRWAERGMPTFPIAISWDAHKQGTNKRPLTPHGHHDASTDPQVVRDLFVQYGDHLRDGEELAAGMRPEFVADCDRHGTGDGPAYADSIGLNGTWTVDTPSHGEHRYYSKQPGATYSNTVPDQWRGLIDVRADSGWVVCPGITTSWGGWQARQPWNPQLVSPLPPHIAEQLKPANPSGSSWRRYRPDQDPLDPATAATHTLLTDHYGIDPHHTTYHTENGREPWLQVTRPGKTFGTSGTIGYVGPGVLWVFTDAWPDLPGNTAYSYDQLALKTRGPWQPNPQDPDDNPYGYLNWQQLWDTDHEDREELIPGIWTVGAGGSIYSPAGAGKSLLGLEWACCLALGQPILDQPTTPRTILYIDLENDEQLIRERLDDLDLHAVPIPNLHYSLLGDWPPLDTEAGGKALLAEATRIKADLIIIDTTSRVISGEENNADTFLALFRHTMRPLKAAGIAVIRFDHAGKNLDKGERGSSAKRSDVDLTYRLTLTGENTVALKREKNRLHLTGPETLHLERLEDPLRHVIRDKDIAHERKVADLIALLDQYDVPTQASRRTTRATLKHYGHKVRDLLLAEALRTRRNRPKVVPEPPAASGATGTTTTRESGSHSGSRRAGNHSGTTGTSPKGGVVPPTPPPIRGGGNHLPGPPQLGLTEPCTNNCGRTTVANVQPCRPCQRGGQP